MATVDGRVPEGMFKDASTNILMWVIRYLNGGDPRDIDREVRAWLDAALAPRAQAFSAAGCALLTTFLKRLADEHKSPNSNTTTIELHLSDLAAPDVIGVESTVQVASALLRNDVEMAHDLLQGHVLAGGDEALVDIGSAAVSMMLGLLASHPDLLKESHGRN